MGEKKFLSIMKVVKTALILRLKGEKVLQMTEFVLVKRQSMASMQHLMG